MTDISYSVVAKKKAIMRYSLIVFLIITCAALWYWNHFANNLAPQKENTLSISGPWEITSLEPSKQGYILMRMQLMETLLNVDDKGKITPALATDWKVEDAGLSWTFFLREKVVFHDGSPLNAKAVVKSLGYSQQKHGILNKAKIESIQAIGDMQIKVQLKQPYAAFSALLTNYSTAILSPASFDKMGEVTTLYGSGPYEVANFAPPHKLTVKKNEHYWGHAASIPFATYQTSHRAESRVLQAKSGEADIVFTLDPAMLSQLEKQDKIKLHTNVIPRTLVLKLNSGHDFLNEVKARQALSFALDRRAITKHVLLSEGTESNQLLPSSMSDWHLEGKTADEYNLAKAADLLAELGWKKQDDGKLYRNGKAFELTLITYADRPELTTTATAIQAQWAKLGVQLKVDITNSSMIPAGHTDGSLEVAMIARNFGSVANPLPIISTDFAKGGGDWGAMNWHNPDVNQALSELAISTDPVRNKFLSQIVANAIYQNRPVLPISSYSQHTAVNERVQGFKFDPYERDYFINQMELD